VSLAVVEVRDANGEMHASQTDGSGEFSVIGLPSGIAIVRAMNHDGEGTRM